MKILFWMSGWFDRHTTSEHLLTEIIAQLCKQGHFVHILQKKTGGTLPLIPSSLDKYPISTEAIPFLRKAKEKLVSRYWAEIKYLIECKKRIKQDYDAVFIQSNTVAGIAVAIIRKKLPHAVITLNIQDIFPYNALYSGKIKNRLLFKLFAAEQRYGYKKSDHIITISEDMKETLISDGVSEKKIDVIYNWSYQDESYTITNNFAVSKMIKKDFFNVVYAGNIGVMQNVDLIIECAKLLMNEKTIWFHIFGNGVYKDQLISKAKGYKIKNISFWPMQTPELAPAIYCAADINIIPLADNIYKTALPSKIATCLACRKKIIFAIGEKSLFGKKIQERTGCQVISCNDPTMLAKAVLSEKENPKQPNTIDFFHLNCNKEKNSKEYARIICTSTH